MCTECHARLDYGNQFFSAVPDVRISHHFIPSMQKAGKGPMYVGSIRDLRGEAPLTPHGFAELATKQPEFAETVARRVEEHVLGWRATTEDRRAIRDAFSASHSVKMAARAALDRLVKHWAAPGGSFDTMASDADHVSMAPMAVRPSSELVEVGPELRSTLDERCVSCHRGGELNFTQPALPRAVMFRMVDQISSARMPKGEPLRGSARDRTLDELIRALWSEPAALAGARRFYIDGMRSLSVVDAPAAIRVIDARAGATGGPPPHVLEAMTPGDQSTLSPDYAAVTMLRAMRSCTAAGRTGDQWEACTRSATRPSTFLNVPANSR